MSLGTPPPITPSSSWRYVSYIPIGRLSWFLKNEHFDDSTCVRVQKKDPIGDGFAMDARLEDAGADFLVPGQVAPVRILGMKVSYFSYANSILFC